MLHQLFDRIQQSTADPWRPKARATQPTARTSAHCYPVRGASPSSSPPATILLARFRRRPERGRPPARARTHKGAGLHEMRASARPYHSLRLLLRCSATNRQLRSHFFFLFFFFPPPPPSPFADPAAAWASGASAAAAGAAAAAFSVSCHRLE